MIKRQTKRAFMTNQKIIHNKLKMLEGPFAWIYIMRAQFLNVLRTLTIIL